ncbi:MAG TPA: zinc metallopeptidase [Planctomycetaceae bacterium]|nr:zinc metallopeptidase [Planctomycetaceae bacterium]
MFYFDPLYFLILGPAILLAMWAQMRVHSAYAQGMQEPSRYTGAEIARMILDKDGLYDLPIEETPGHLSDHYDPQARVVRLSSGVYHSRSLAAVGIAAHEVGHALQHAHHYGPLALRSIAAPAAMWGPGAGMVLLVIGFIMRAPALLALGIVAFSAVAVFQLVNLPVEFDASNRAKRLLTDMGVVDDHGSRVVRSVLNAAAWTYVAATLQSILQVLYYVIHIMGAQSRRDD